MWAAIAAVCFLAVPKELDPQQPQQAPLVLNTEVEILKSMDTFFGDEWFLRVTVFQARSTGVTVIDSSEFDYDSGVYDMNEAGHFDWTERSAPDRYLFSCPAVQNPFDPYDPGNSTGAFFFWFEQDGSRLFGTHPDKDSITIAAVLCSNIPQASAPANGVLIPTFSFDGKPSQVLRFRLRRGVASDSGFRGKKCADYQKCCEPAEEPGLCYLCWPKDRPCP